MALSRFLILTLFLALTLFANSQDFKSCQLKYQVSSVEVDKTQAFAINTNYVLFYSASQPQAKIIKRDPFLGLNLMKADKHFKHSFKFYNNKPKQLASVLPHSALEGKILEEQIGLNQLGRFSKKTKKNAFISAIDEARFRQPVLPGDQLRIEVTIAKRKLNICRFQGNCFVNNTLVAGGLVSANIVDRAGA